MLAVLDPWCVALCNHTPRAFCDSTPTSICTCDFSVPSQNTFYSRCATVTDEQCDDWCNVVGTCHHCCTTDQSQAIPKFAAVCPEFTDSWCTSYCNTDMEACEEEDCCVPADQAHDNDADGYVAYFDCNDSDPAINPGAVDVCDGVDNDCDGVVDEGFVCSGLTLDAPVASNLCSPRSVSFAEGVMYIPETGLGGADNCQFFNGQNECLGDTAAVLTVENSVKSTLVGSLPSQAAQVPDGSVHSANGVARVVVTPDGTEYVILGSVAHGVPDTFADPRPQTMASVARVESGSLVSVAQLWVAEVNQDPDGDYNSNPVAGALNPLDDDELFVVDAGANAVWSVALSTGDVSVAASLPGTIRACIPGSCDFLPPFACCNSGATEYPTQSVPTDGEFRPGHPTKLYISEFTGVFWNDAAARIHVFDTSDSSLTVLEPFRFVSAMSIAFAGSDSLYVLEYHPMTGANTLQHIDLTSNTMAEVVQATALTRALGITWHNGALYVSDKSNAQPSTDPADCIGEVARSA